jgi:hypothetical protein
VNKEEKSEEVNFSLFPLLTAAVEGIYLMLHLLRVCQQLHLVSPHQIFLPPAILDLDDASSNN